MRLSDKHKPLGWVAAGAAAAFITFLFLFAVILRPTNTVSASSAGAEAAAGGTAVNPAAGGSADTPGNPQAQGPLTVLPEEPEKGITTDRPYGKKLTADGSRNVLIIGEDRVSGLCDTIGIASIGKKERKVTLIMLPRDMYVAYNKSITRFIENQGMLDEPGYFKLNNVHHIGALLKYKGSFPNSSVSFLADVIKEKFGITADDYVKINTQGFVEVVDLFGGVQIDVPYDMNYDDPFQELSIHLEKGQQLLDGKKAEGFVRYRQGADREGKPNDIGDAERKKNQLAFINAFIKQHGTLSNIGALPGLLKSMSRNVQHSVGLGDALNTYLGVLKDIISDKYEIESINITGRPQNIRNSSYVVIGD